MIIDTNLAIKIKKDLENKLLFKYCINSTNILIINFIYSKIYVCYLYKSTEDKYIRVKYTNLDNLLEFLRGI
mgnify:CR=1 FL=1